MIARGHGKANKKVTSLARYSGIQRTEDRKSRRTGQSGEGKRFWKTLKGKKNDILFIPG
jgi:hypothetical protein